MKMKLFCVIFLISFVTSEPQLDLPRVQSTSVPKNSQEGPRVLVLPNSYADDKHDLEPKSDSSYPLESDRSQRYG